MVVSLRKYTSIGETGIYISEEREWRQIGPVKATNVNRVISLRKYRIPSENNVVDLIVEKAYDLKKDPNKEVKEGSLEAELKKLSNLQGDILESIRNRNEEIILFIRKNTSAPDIKESERRENIIVRYGVLPYQYADKIREENRIVDDEDVFTKEEIKKLGLGHKWSLHLKLVNGLMPSRKVMNILIGCRTSESIYHTIIGEHVDPKEIMRVLNNLYASVPTRDRTRKIKDVSESYLETLTKEPIKRMTEIEERKREQNSKSLGISFKIMRTDMPN